MQDLAALFFMSVFGTLCIYLKVEVCGWGVKQLSWGYLFNKVFQFSSQCNLNLCTGRKIGSGEKLCEEKQMWNERQIEIRNVGIWRGGGDYISFSQVIVFLMVLQCNSNRIGMGSGGGWGMFWVCWWGMAGGEEKRLKLWCWYTCPSGIPTIVQIFIIKCNQKTD